MTDCTKCIEKPCCKDELMSVELSLDFLFRLASHLELKPEEVFDKYCEVQPQYAGSFSYQSKVSLKSPCPFLDNDCKIHSIKPLTCLWFPASSIYENQFLYTNYPCKNNTLEGVQANEIEFYRKIIPLVMEAQNLSDQIFFKGNKLNIDIRELRREYPEIEIYCQWLEGRIKIENETIDERDKRQLEVDKIVSKEIWKRIKKETVFIRIRMIKSQINDRIKEINNQYFTLRESYNLWYVAGKIYHITLSM